MQLDPQYALAHASIAEAYAFLSIASATIEAMAPREVVPLALAAAQRALALDDRLSEAHAVLGHVALNFDWNWAAAEAHLQRAISLKPNNPHAHQFYSMGLASLGRTEEALAELKLARELDPTSVIIRANIGFTLYRARRYEEAIAELRNCVALAPESAYARYRFGLALQEAGQHAAALEQFEAMLHLPGAEVQALVGKAHALAVCGRTKEARECMDRLLALAGERYVSAYFFAEIHAGLGEPEEAIRWLDRACEERAVPMISIQVNPKFDPLREHADFQAIVRRIGLWDEPSRLQLPVRANLREPPLSAVVTALVVWIPHGRPPMAPRFSRGSGSQPDSRCLPSPRLRSMSLPAEPVHQLRIYEIFDTTSKPSTTRFRDHAMRIMKKYGLQHWRDVGSEERPSARSSCICSNGPDEPTMKDRWAKFMADKEWADIKKETRREARQAGRRDSGSNAEPDGILAAQGLVALTLASVRWACDGSRCNPYAIT